MVGGLLTAAVIKFAGNILKTFATSLSMIMTCLISMPLFGYQPTLLFWVGLSLTCIATVLYACKPKTLRGVRARCTWQLGRMLSVQEPPPPAPGSTSTSMSAAMELGRGLSCAASEHAAPAVELGRSSTLKAPKPTSGTRRPASNLPGASKKRGALRALRASSHRFQKLACEDGLVAATETSIVDDDAHHVATELEERCFRI